MILIIAMKLLFTQMTRCIINLLMLYAGIDRQSSSLGLESNIRTDLANQAGSEEVTSDLIKYQYGMAICLYLGSSSSIFE